MAPINSNLHLSIPSVHPISYSAQFSFTIILLKSFTDVEREEGFPSSLFFAYAWKLRKWAEMRLLPILCFQVAVFFATADIYCIFKSRGRWKPSPAIRTCRSHLSISQGTFHGEFKCRCVNDGFHEPVTSEKDEDPMPWIRIMQIHLPII